ncbi:MAG: SMC-Scp complex subunit ScpB [Deltaproteobacteria bacterium]|nr:SMC-Scp complex subunit ScpB [Candidatus Anaeroferrophillacea bacterium]
MDSASLYTCKDIIESLLLVAAEPLTPAALGEVLEIDDNELIAAAVDHLEDEYRRRNRGFLLQRVGGGIRLVTREENAPYIRRYIAGKPVRFSRAALETLAIVAYRQPVTRPEIDAVRGVDSSGVIRQLLTRELITIKGRKDVPGSPMLYVTTDRFLQIFNLRTLSSLPDIKSFGDLYPAAELPLLDRQVEG